MVRRSCSFCAGEIEPGTGMMFVRRDGAVLYFCSAVCRKDQLSLGRVGHRLKWTRAYATRKAMEKARPTAGSKEAKPTAADKPKAPPAGAVKTAPTKTAPKPTPQAKGTPPPKAAPKSTPKSATPKKDASPAEKSAPENP